MLTFRGSKQRYCDGVTRRDFLTVGALSMAGLSLADVYRLRAQELAATRQKSVILIYLGGGPSHIDMYDLKPDAPAEFRGEFKPIKTNVAGIDISELMPLQAQIADKLAILRGVKMSEPHGPHMVHTGFAQSGFPGVIRPAFGSVVSRVRSGNGLGGNPLPPYVSFNEPANIFYENPVYLGPGHRPFFVGDGRVRSLELRPEISVNRLQDRQALLQTFDTLQRDLDTKGEMAGSDAFTARALDMISSPRTRAAFDISTEPAKVKEKYGRATTVLQARRLVEAGVSVVSLRLGSRSWDTHANNFGSLRVLIPEVDQAIYALVTDLHERGLDQDVAVIAWGEFGRTPKIGDTTPDGRGHWPDAAFALLAGGGLRLGQVVGETDNRAGRAKGRPITPQNVFATLYHVLGIDPATTFNDNNGRPQFLLDDHEKIAALV